MDLTSQIHDPYSVIMRILLVACSCLVASAAGAATPADTGPWLSALTSAFVLMDLSTGDLDGDGRDETVVCYRQDLSGTDQAGGIAVLSGKPPDLRPVFHVQMEATLCEKVRVNGRKLGILLQGNKQLVWTYGEELRFRTDKAGLIGGAEIKASSSLGGSNGAKAAMDGDLKTSWAEGASGTGIGQSITVRLPRATDVGAVAIYCGAGSSERAFFDANRIHRGSIEAKSEADLGDTAAGVDFAALGISGIGDRTEFSCENRPQVTYVHLSKRAVLELQVRIESVYLGDKKDDTHIAELEIVPRLALTETLDRARAVTSKDGEPPANKANRDAAAKGATDATAKAPKAEPNADEDDALRRLDAEGGSLVTDDI